VQEYQAYCTREGTWFSGGSCKAERLRVARPVLAIPAASAKSSVSLAQGLSSNSLTKSCYERLTIFRGDY